MLIELKQKEISLVCGRKGGFEHFCIVIKETVKAAGMAYCIALDRENAAGMFERVGKWSEPKKRTVCTAAIVGAAEGLYHITESMFGFDEKK